MIQPKAVTLALMLHQFFVDYLPRQRALSPHTLCSYRDSIKLLLQFLAKKSGDVTKLTVEHFNVTDITAFLQHLETRRRSCTATRNVRLSAIHSFFRYLGAQCPEHLAQAQRILSIPFKRTSTREIQHLNLEEILAVLGAVDSSVNFGRRDLSLLSLMFNTGARVSEIVALQTDDLQMASAPSVLLRGKGRKERICPIWPETAHLLEKRLEERGINPSESAVLFLNHRGMPLTRFGVRLILKKYVREATKNNPTLKHKRLHPHCLRHSAAVQLLRSGVDLSTIAHWLGHASVNTTNKYLSVDLEAKREAITKAKPKIVGIRNSAKWRRDSDLIAWLETL
jgi:integrase/recombinase XerD